MRRALVATKVGALHGQRGQRAQGARPRAPWVPGRVMVPEKAVRQRARPVPAPDLGVIAPKAGASSGVTHRQPSSDGGRGPGEHLLDRSAPGDVLVGVASGGATELRPWTTPTSPSASAWLWAGGRKCSDRPSWSKGEPYEGTGDGQRSPLRLAGTERIGQVEVVRPPYLAGEPRWMIGLGKSGSAGMAHCPLL